MRKCTEREFTSLLERYPSLQCCEKGILSAFELLLRTAQSNHVIFSCGNGGSAADSEHIVGELMKCFKLPRPINQDLRSRIASCGTDGMKLSETLEGGIKAVSLTSHIALSTAYSNDRCPSAVFAQQLSVLGEAGDALITISTSGNSENCVYAAITARAKGITVVALTGAKESKLSQWADAAIRVPATETYQIQELHLPIYHALCAMLECELFQITD